MIEIPKKWKGISSVAGAFTANLVMGSVYTWGNINTYYTSYLKYHDSPNIKIVDGFFLMPIIVYISNLLMYIGPKLDNKGGVKKCLLGTIIMTILSHIMLLFSTKLSVVYFAMIIFGSSIGVSYLTIMKNAWGYFPNSKGLVSGIVLFGYGGSAGIFTTISDKNVNPNFEKADPYTGFFSQVIADRMYYFIYQGNIILAILGVIAYFLIVEYKDDTNTKASGVAVKTNAPIVEVFTQRQIWQIIFMNFGNLYFCYMLANTNRSFGQLNGIDESILSLASKASALINGGGRIVWGGLFDKFGFKILFIIVVVTEIILSAIVFYIGANAFLFFLIICLTSFMLAGTIAVMMPGYPKIFGIKYSTEINSGVIGIYGCCSILSPIIAKFLVKEKSDYKALYLSGTFFGLISFFSVLTFREVSFNYKNEPGPVNEKTHLIGLEEALSNADMTQLVNK